MPVVVLVTDALCEDAPVPSNLHLTKTLPSPIGTLTLVASGKGLVSISFSVDRLTGGMTRAGTTSTCDVPVNRTDSSCMSREDLAATIILERTQQQLEEYFTRRRRNFDIALDCSGSSGFAQQVRKGLLQIGYGQRWSYGQLAAALGHPGAARVVGSACGRNPVPIVVPCHRVVRADGSAGGYRGGTNAKRFLLELEAAPRARTRLG